MDDDMDDDIELFIIWNKGRNLEDKILADIGSKYEIVKICEITWSKHHFSENLSRFYGKKLPRGCKKIRECGTGPFLLIIVRDPNHMYVNGKNLNMASNKYHYRQIYGGGFLIHASDSQNEAAENFLFISGQNINDFVMTQHQPQNDKYIAIKQDLVGTKYWKDKTQVLQVLNIFPDIKINMDNDIWEVQTDNINLIRRILNANKIWFKKNLYTLNLREAKKKIRINPFS